MALQDTLNGIGQQLTNAANTLSQIQFPGVPDLAPLQAGVGAIEKAVGDLAAKANDAVAAHTGEAPVVEGTAESPPVT